MVVVVQQGEKFIFGINIENSNICFSTDFHFYHFDLEQLKEVNTLIVIFLNMYHTTNHTIGTFVEFREKLESSDATLFHCI